MDKIGGCSFEEYPRSRIYTATKKDYKCDVVGAGPANEPKILEGGARGMVLLCICSIEKIMPLREKPEIKPYKG